MKPAQIPPSSFFLLPSSFFLLLVPPLSLFPSLVLRDLATHRVRAITTVIGIALGIAVVLAVRLAATSAVRGFERAVESLAGRASLEITQSALGVDESGLPALAWLEDFGRATPVIEGEAVWKAPDGTQEMLRVLGVDILTDQAFRDYVFAETGGERAQSTREVLGLLTDARSVVLTQKFAAPRGIRVGDAVRLEMGDAAREFRVRALLADEGPARAMDGHVVLMDIAAAHWALDRLGFVDRVEVRLRDGADMVARFGQHADQICLGQGVDERVVAFRRDILAEHDSQPT